MLPSAGRARLEAFVRGRTEWCLSRQRSWGVPLPVFYHVDTGEALLDDEVLAHVQQLIGLHGSDCWWTLPVEELLPPRRAHEAGFWRRGTDTMDVWFDSGSSWSAVLAKDRGGRGAAGVPSSAVPSSGGDGAGSRDGGSGGSGGGAGGGGAAGGAGGGPLADLYLEGSDQHRGWFQSSLLTHVGSHEGGGAPYRMIITHGFVVDEHGAKMSKSIGNVIMPSQLLGPSSIDAPTYSKGADGDDAPAATTTTASAAATGAQDGANSRAPPALDAALDAAALSALEAQIGAQGILVRELKVAAKGGTSKKAEVDAAVAALVALKAKLPVEATAAAPRAEGAAPNHKKLQKEARKARDDRAPYGVDVLRLWVATADWKGDVALGDAVLERSRDIYRRLRNACRFCLGNLYDFDESVDALPLEQLRLGDRHMLHTLAEHTRVVQASYDAYELNRVVAATLALATERLSAEYFHATKDRLYCGHATGASRRAVQTVLHASLDTILLSIGPIAPFLVEEVHEHRAQPRPPPPIDRTWGEPPAAWHQPKLARQWALARLVEEQVTLVLHEARVDKRIAGGGEALVELQTAPGSELHAALEYLGPELNDLLGVSATRLTALTSGESAASAVVDVHELVCSYDGMLKAQVPLQHEHALRIWVRKTTAPKCPRCWRHVPTAAVLEEAESARLDDGWLYRGCPGFGQAGCLKEAAQVGS